MDAHRIYDKGLTIVNLCNSSSVFLTWGPALLICYGSHATLIRHWSESFLVITFYPGGNAWGIRDTKRLTFALEYLKWMVSFWPRVCALEWWLWCSQAVLEYAAWSLVWTVKSCFVILDRIKNFIGDHFSKLQHGPAKFQHFWQFRQKFDNWKIEVSLTAPVLMTSKGVTVSPLSLPGQASLPISKIDTAYQYHRTVPKSLPQGARYTFGAYQNWRN